MAPNTPWPCHSALQDSSTDVLLKKAKTNLLGNYYQPHGNSIGKEVKILESGSHVSELPFPLLLLSITTHCAPM
eukprot:3993546-Amphidinium_carterae.3